MEPRPAQRARRAIDLIFPPLVALLVVLFVWYLRR